MVVVAVFASAIAMGPVRPSVCIQPGCKANRGISYNGLCKKCRTDRWLQGSSAGGSNGTGECKAKAFKKLNGKRRAANARKGGLLSAIKRNMEHCTQGGDLRPPDLTFQAFVTEQNAIDQRRAAGRAPPWTEHPLLEHGFFERCDRMKDAVSKQLIHAVAGLRRRFQPDQARAAAIRVCAGLRLTQSARGTAYTLAGVAHSPKLFRLELQQTKCGNGVYRGVVRRVDQPPLIEALVRKFMGIQTFDDVFDAAARVSQTLKLPPSGKSATERTSVFHAAQIAFDLIDPRLALGFRVLKKDDCPLLIGSRRGLNFIRQFTGDSSITLATLAAECNMDPVCAQTSLCAYGKYVLSWNLGLTRWYKPLRANKNKSWLQRGSLKRTYSEI